MTEDFHDELDEHIAESMKDPEYRKAAEAIDRWYAGAVKYRCPRECCVSYVHPDDDATQTGWGPVDCPHANDEPQTVRDAWTKIEERHP